MAVRHFNGTSDDLTTSAGAAGSMTYGTFAFLIKQHTNRTLEQCAFALLSSGSANLRAIAGTTSSSGGSNNMQGVIFNGPDYDQSGTITNGLNNWLLCVVRKPTGSVAARWSVYHYGTSTWTHFNTGDTTLANWTSIGGTGVIRLYDTDQYPALRIAARALWANEVKWSADSTGDAAIVSANLHTSGQAWIDAAPGLLHFFNQTSTSDPVNDQIGSANQTAISGTTVITDDDPPGFSFPSSSGKSADATLTSAPALTAAGTVDRSALSTLSLTPALTISGEVGKFATGSLSVAPALSASGQVGKLATASLSATPSLQASGEALSAGEGTASLAVTSTLAATGFVNRSTTASPISLGVSLDASGVTGAGNVAALSGAVTLAADGFVERRAAAVLALTEGLTVAAQRGVRAAAGLDLAAPLTVSDSLGSDQSAALQPGVTLTAVGGVNVYIPPQPPADLQLRSARRVGLTSEYEVTVRWRP